MRRGRSVPWAPAPSWAAWPAAGWPITSGGGIRSSSEASRGDEHDAPLRIAQRPDDHVQRCCSGHQRKLSSSGQCAARGPRAENKRVRAYAAFRLAANAGLPSRGAGGLIATTPSFWLFAAMPSRRCLLLIALLWLPHGLRAQIRNARGAKRSGSSTRPRISRGLDRVVCASMVYAQTARHFRCISPRKPDLDLFGLHSHRRRSTACSGWNGVLIMFAELPLTALTLRYNPRRVMRWLCARGRGFRLNALAHTFRRFGSR